MRATISLLALLALWLTASAISNDDVLPSPYLVAIALIEEIRSGEMFRHLAATLARTVAAFTVAMSVGAALGVLMGNLQMLNRWLDPWLILFLNMPALVIIVLSYVWIGLNESAVIVAVALNKIPAVAVTMREGARSLEPKYFALARVFQLRPLDILRHITLPQLVPYLVASARTGLSLIWKIILLVELLGRSNGVGFQINLYFQLFNIDLILAYALAFIAVMMTVELTIMQPLERRANRWRHC